jgi:hypothetical protein
VGRIVTTMIVIAVGQIVAGRAWGPEVDMGRGPGKGRLVDRGRGMTFGFTASRMGWMGQ